MLDAIAACARAVLYGSALSAAGLSLAIASLRLPDALERYALRLMRIASAATILFSVALAGLLIARLGGEFDETIVSAVFGSGSGAGFALQVAGALLLVTSAGDDAFTRAWRASSALIITISFAFSGHAAAMSPQASLLAFVHVSAAAWWVGSLWLLQRACAAEHQAETAAIVSRFSSLAVVVVGGLAGAGVLLIVALIDFQQTPWFTRYVQLLAIKIGVAMLALSLALFNKVRLTQRLQRDEHHAAADLRRSIRAELALIAAVLLTTAFLTTYFSPHEG